MEKELAPEITEGRNVIETIEEVDFVFVLRIRHQILQIHVNKRSIISLINIRLELEQEEFTLVLIKEIKGHLQDILKIKFAAVCFINITVTVDDLE